MKRAMLIAMLVAGLGCDMPALSVRQSSDAGPGADGVAQSALDGEFRSCDWACQYVEKETGRACR